MSQVSENFIRQVDRVFLNGYSLKSMNLTDDAKRRITMVKEVYSLFTQNPFLDVRQTLRNIARRDGFDRSPVELRNDIYVFNHVVSLLSVANRDVDRIKVDRASDWLMHNGMSSGNDRAVASGAKIKMALNQNFAEESEGYENIAEMPILITNDVSVVKKDRKNLSDEEKEQIFKKYGAKQAEFEELVLNDRGEYESMQHTVAEEPEYDVFRENP